MSQPDEATPTPSDPPQAEEVPGGGRFANAVAKRILYHMGVAQALKRERDKLAKRCKKLETIIDLTGYDDLCFQECTYCGELHDITNGWRCKERNSDYAHKFWCRRPHCKPYLDALWCKQCGGGTCHGCLAQCLVCLNTPHCANCKDCKAV